MGELDPHFLNVAASQICLDGADGVNLDELLPLSGLTRQDYRRLFPDGRSLFLAVIENTALLQERQLQRELEGVADPVERFVRSVTSDLSFAGSNLQLSQAIALAMFSNDMATRQRLEEVYERHYARMAGELISIGVISEKSRKVTADITPLLLSLTFLGSCPDLPMDYLAMVDYRRTALSLLDALRRRFGT